MKILAIIDLDTNRERGQAENLMIANTSERSRIAREYANQFGSRDQNSAFFAKLYDPELVHLDAIEDQAHTLIEQIEARGAQVVYLISRPHTMRAATEQWLAEHQLARRSVYKNYGTGERINADVITRRFRVEMATYWTEKEMIIFFVSMAH